MKEKKKTDEEMLNISAIEGDILSVLQARELYGLDILNRLNPGRPIPLSFGSLYPTLNRLEKKGLIEWRWGDEQEETGGARRKYYKVTGLGASVFNEWQTYRARLAMQAQGSTALGGI
ncbi:helix-turn-helix transcriptional regulator [Calothrix membranacea FACHB-236]|nr:helix-turn-helix transcriptional regulator [Calothrix membranacea FACHB-236]